MLDPSIVIPNQKTSEVKISLENVVSLTKETGVLVFSSHLDDAVLSMGSLIGAMADEEIPISIVSMFTQGSQAESESITTILDRAGYETSGEYFKERRLEDVASIEILGKNIRTIHKGFIDAAWRTNNSSPIYPRTQLDQVSPKDGTTLEQLKKSMTEIVRSSRMMIFAPLGIGGHVDHVLTRDAANSVFDSLIYYVDFPYSLRFGMNNNFISKNELLPVIWTGDYEKKKQAILRYETQQVSLFYRGQMRLPWEKFYLNSKLYKKLV